MNLPLTIFFGLAPSIIWLLFYLRKDAHPESGRMILKIFFWGMIITLIAAFVEIGIERVLDAEKTFANVSEASQSGLFLPSLYSLLYGFLGIALVEEFLKYLVVKEKVINNPEFDEPVDAMIYMVISGLGFAALENILVLLPLGNFPLTTASVSALRFVGATFLHALCSATIGYFLALSFYSRKRRFFLVTIGITIATILHGIYNFSIIKSVDNNYFLYVPIILLTGLAIFVSFGFKRLKEKASVCRV
jgi:protease PrsW